MGSRALSPVVGFVILVGIAAVSSVALFAVGLSIAEGAQGEAQMEQAEQSMAEFAEQADSTAAGEQVRASFAFEEDDDVSMDGDAGSITINYTGTSDPIVDGSLGKMVYESDDGERLAYQAGAVWRDDGNGVRMVEPPQFQYRATTDETATLTFPIIKVNGSGSVSGDGELAVANRTDQFPNENASNPLGDGKVLVTLESEYCEGYEAHFDERTDGAVNEGCDEGTNGEVIVELVIPVTFEANQHGVAVQNEIDDDIEVRHDAGTYDDYVEDVSLNSVSGVVNEMASECDEQFDTNSEDHYDTNPVYCVEQDLNRDYTFHTGGEDFELVVTDSVNVFENHEVSIEGGGSVTIYVRNASNIMDGGGNAKYGNESATDQLRLVVASDIDEIGPIQQQVQFYGILYAPNTDVILQDVHHGEFEGALVASSLSAEKDNQDPSITVTDEAKNLDLEFDRGGGEGDEVYYLHVSETVLEVESE